MLDSTPMIAAHGIVWSQEHDRLARMLVSNYNSYAKLSIQYSQHLFAWTNMAIVIKQECINIYDQLKSCPAVGTAFLLRWLCSLLSTGSTVIITTETKIGKARSKSTQGLGNDAYMWPITVSKARRCSARSRSCGSDITQH